MPYPLVYQFNTLTYLYSVQQEETNVNPNPNPNVLMFYPNPNVLTVYANPNILMFYPNPVTRSAKTLYSHTSDFSTLTNYNFKSTNDIALKFLDVIEQ